MPNPSNLNNVEELREQVVELLSHFDSSLAEVGTERSMHGDDDGPGFVDHFMDVFHKALEAKSLETARTLHNNIDVTFNLIEKIQPGYEGNRTIGAGELQRLLCEYEDELSNTPKTQEKE